MSNYLAGAGQRDIYIKDSGNDINEGFNAVFAVQTLPRAIALANALVPAPGLSEPAAIVDSGSSRYDGPFLQPDNVQAAMSFCAVALPVTGTPATCVVAGASAQCSFQTIQTTATSGDVGYSTNGKTRVNLDARAIILNGPDQVGYQVDGASSDTFCNVGQILGRGNNNTLVNIISTGAQPRSFEYNELNMEGTTSTGIYYNSNVAAVASIRVGAITDTGGASNVGIHAVSGRLACNVNEIDCETAIIVENGATLDIFDAHIGDCKIIVNTGGTLNINALSYGGDVNVDITEDGTINGVIGGRKYGDAKDLGYTVISSDNKLVQLEWSERGRNIINGNKTRFNSVIADYTSLGGIATTMEVRVAYSNPNNGLDPRNGEVYFFGSAAEGSNGPHQIVLSPTVTPMPSIDAVYLRVEVRVLSASTAKYYNGINITYTEL